MADLEYVGRREKSYTKLTKWISAQRETYCIGISHASGKMGTRFLCKPFIGQNGSDTVDGKFTMMMMMIFMMMMIIIIIISNKTRNVRIT